MSSDLGRLKIGSGKSSKPAEKIILQVIVDGRMQPFDHSGIAAGKVTQYFAQVPAYEVQFTIDLHNGTNHILRGTKSQVPFTGVLIDEAHIVVRIRGRHPPGPAPTFARITKLHTSFCYDLPETILNERCFQHDANLFFWE
jgi:hypothetical protein